LSKKPIAAIAVSPQKQPRIANDPTSFNDKKPSWRVSRMEFADPFGWHTVTANELSHIRQKLSNFESMTWNEILVKAKKNNHSVAVDALCAMAQKRLRDIHYGDLDELVSLRLGSIERVWGILQEGVLIILWWDPEHRVCPSLKG
jgi:hypothetical protein